MTDRLTDSQTDGHSHLEKALLALKMHEVSLKSFLDIWMKPKKFLIFKQLFQRRVQVFLYKKECIYFWDQIQNILFGFGFSFYLWNIVHFLYWRLTRRPSTNLQNRTMLLTNKVIVHFDRFGSVFFILTNLVAVKVL